ncbi:hypothetical protein TNCV_82901 [Trichonephila clavipes]|nr:hypothetical protein TNCV_82901 [Trichonephila clavipes]
MQTIVNSYQRNKNKYLFSLEVPVQGGRCGRERRLQGHPRAGRLPQEYRREGRSGAIHLLLGYRVLAFTAQKGQSFIILCFPIVPRS